LGDSEGPRIKLVFEGTGGALQGKGSTTKNRKKGWEKLIDRGKNRILRKGRGKKRKMSKKGGAKKKKRSNSPCYVFPRRDWSKENVLGGEHR